MKYSIDEILGNTSGYIFYQNPNFDKSLDYYPCGINSYVRYNKSTIYIPIHIYINGALVNSFNNIEKVINAGVRAIMFDEVRFADKAYYEMLMQIIETYQDKLDLVIMVPDTLQAIFDLANYTRTNKISKKTKYIAITGSIGKTSTTEMIYGILSQNHKVYRGEPGANIKLRVAHKFLEVEPDIDYFIFECSGQGRGYLKCFSELIMPDAVILSKVSNENLGEYLTLKNVAIEKSTLLSAMKEDSTAIINGMDILREASEIYSCKKVYIDEGCYELIKADKDGSEFIYKDEKYFIPVVGKYQIDNAIKVIELLLSLGFSTEEIKHGLSLYEAVGDRWVVDKFKNGVEFITDCPNNPSYDTLIANINTFMNLYKDAGYKRIIITRIKALGDLEEQTYRNIAEFISKLDIDELICVGSEIIPIRDYVRANSNISVMWFEKPTEINENDTFVKYLLETLNFEQATLLKGQRKDGTIGYGKVKEVLRKYLK